MTEAPAARWRRSAWGQEVAQARRVYPETGLYAVQAPNGNLLFVRAQYIVGFVEGQRVLTPELDFPLGNRAVEIGNVAAFDAHFTGSDLVIAGAGGNSMVLRHFRNVELGFPLGSPRTVEIPTAFAPSHVFLGPRNEWVYSFERRR